MPQEARHRCASQGASNANSLAQSLRDHRLGAGENASPEPRDQKYYDAWPKYHVVVAKMTDTWPKSNLVVARNTQTFWPCVAKIQQNVAHAWPKFMCGQNREAFWSRVAKIH